MLNSQGDVFIVVYYRDIPIVLKSLVARDGRMKISKDGVHNSIGHSCPRMTIAVESISADKDVERMKRLMSLLAELESNNQIVSFSARRQVCQNGL